MITRKHSVSSKTYRRNIVSDKRNNWSYYDGKILPGVARQWSHSGLESWIRVYKERRFGSKVCKLHCHFSSVLHPPWLFSYLFVSARDLPAFYGVFLLSCSVAPFCGFYLWLLCSDFCFLFIDPSPLPWVLSFFLRVLNITILTTYELFCFFICINVWTYEITG